MRVPSRGSRSTAGTTTRWCSCAHIAAAIHRVEPLRRSSPRCPAAAVSWSTPVISDARCPPSSARCAGARRSSTRSRARPAWTLLAQLVDYVPAGSRIAVAGRETPPLPAGPLACPGTCAGGRRRGAPAGRREAGLLLEAAGVELDAAGLLASDRTDGGLARRPLPRRAVDGGPPRARGFAGDDRFVAEYFRVELLSGLAAADAEFLMRTSVLDRLCGPLCDSVLQTTRSADTLETLASANGFIVPLDRRGRWYRYHHLFGELLRDELERTEPELVPALNRRAMEWCVANDCAEAAVAYGHAAGDLDTVAGAGRRARAAALFRRPDGDRRGVADVVRRRRSRAVPRARRHRRLVRVPLPGGRRRRAMARLADGGASALPLDGGSRHRPWVATCGAHDARRRRAGARGRRARARSALRRRAIGARPRSSSAAWRTRCSAPPIARRGDLDRSRRGARRAGSRKTSTWAGRCSRCSPAKRGTWAEAAPPRAGGAS